MRNCSFAAPTCDCTATCTVIGDCKPLLEPRPTRLIERHTQMAPASMFEFMSEHRAIVQVLVMEGIFKYSSIYNGMKVRRSCRNADTYSEPVIMAWQINQH